jgi:hypothetical protein
VTRSGAGPGQQDLGEVEAPDARAVFGAGHAREALEGRAPPPRAAAKRSWRDYEGRWGWTPRGPLEALGDDGAPFAARGAQGAQEAQGGESDDDDPASISSRRFWEQGAGAGARPDSDA